MSSNLAELVGIDVPTRLLIGGEWTGGRGGGTMPVIDPATEDALTEVADGTVEDALDAVDAASGALAGWAATPPRQRAECLRRTFELMTSHGESLARLMVAENGKALRDARAEAAYSAEFFRWYAEEAVRMEGVLMNAPSGANKILVMRQPVGVSVLVTPWNFPAAMATRKIGPALAAGCTVVLKPASETPLTALAIAGLLAEAGVPDGVVNVLPSRKSGAVVSAMLNDPRVRKLSFTGSTEVGRILLREAAETVVNTSMELGGNAPFVIFEDADIDAAVEGALIAKMRNGGEACTAANRFYVHEAVAGEFSRKFAARLDAMKVGPGLDEGTDVGPLVNEPTRSKVAELVESAAADGGTVITGGQAPDRRGFFYQPTVIDQVPSGRRHPRHRDLRAGGARGAVHHRGRRRPLGQRHRVRAGLLRVHPRPEPRAAGQRGTRGRDGRPQPRHRVRPGGAVRRREAVGHRPRGRARRAPGVHRDEIYRHQLVTRSRALRGRPHHHGPVPGIASCLSRFL